MTLEISLRKPFNLPNVFRSADRKPEQDYHWVGHRKDSIPLRPDPDPGKQSRKDTNRKDKHRPLGELTLSEVEETYKRFECQLVPAHENWIGKNFFCQIPLKRKRDGRPPLIFGRVITCFPSDGALDNVEELVLAYPRLGDAPDLFHIIHNEINLTSQKQLQSYYVRVRVFTTDEEASELSDADPLMDENGFYIEYATNALDLLDMNEGNKSEHPWMYLIGSRWFHEIPESFQKDVEGKLREMVGWGSTIFNYHPEWLGHEIPTFNKVLGYKFGFTSTVLTEPGNMKEISIIVTQTFNNMAFA